MPTAWFLCPYIHDKVNGLWRRRTAIDIYSEDISAADGKWSEAEIDGDQALSYCNGPTGILNNLGREFPRLTQTEAETTWTPLRAAPYYDIPSDSIKFSTTEFVPCRTLSSVMSEVEAGFASVELLALLALWLGLGFGLGWRLPYDVACWAARHIGEPTPFWRELLKFTITTDGAFPVNTAIIDNFDRADENPATGWGNTYGSDFIIKILSNQAAGAGAGAHTRGYWTANTFGLNSGVETYFDIPIAHGAETTRYITASTRIVNPGAGTVDMYEFENTATTGWVFRVDNGSATTLGATVSVSWANGNSMGIDHVNGIVGIYKEVSGVWSQYTNRVDGTYNDLAGHLGLRTSLGAGRFDNFGGGSVGIAAALAVRDAFKRILRPSVFAPGIAR